MSCLAEKTHQRKDGLYMFESLILFLKELFFKNENLAFTNHEFNVFRIVMRSIIILSFILNYYLIRHYIVLADNHYKLETAVIVLKNKYPECIVTIDDYIYPKIPVSVESGKK